MFFKMKLLIFIPVLVLNIEIKAIKQIDKEKADEDKRNNGREAFENFHGVNSFNQHTDLMFRGSSKFTL